MAKKAKKKSHDDEDDDLFLDEDKASMEAEKELLKKNKKGNKVGDIRIENLLGDEDEDDFYGESDGIE